jgi:hypothetical protein
MNQCTLYLNGPMYFILEPMYGAEMNLCMVLKFAYI